MKTRTKRSILIKIFFLFAIGAGIFLASNFLNQKETISMTENDFVSQSVMPSIDESVPTNTKTASFGLGWFWGADSQFGSISGVIRTRVGYTGGNTENPTYTNLGDHTETVQMDYDPTQISYAELLEFFWEGHNPTNPSHSRQYASIIFYHNDEQKKLAAESLKAQGVQCDCQIYTEAVQAGELYWAEDYHQKYRLRQSREFMSAFEAIYPDNDDFVNSTAAARVNGYLGGYGSLADLQEEINDLGLSPAAQEKLLDLVRQY